MQPNLPCAASRSWWAPTKAAQADFIHGQIWADELMPANVGLTIQTGPIYTLLRAGIQHLGDRPRWSLGLGLGYHRNIVSKLYLEPDLSAVTLHVQNDWEELPLLSQLRVLVGWQVAPMFAVFAGPSFNVLVNFGDQRAAQQGFRLPGWRGIGGSAERVAWWPGLTLGVRI